MVLSTDYKPLRLLTSIVLCFILFNCSNLFAQDHKEKATANTDRAKELNIMLEKAMDHLYTSTDSVLMYTNRAWNIAQEMDEDLYRAKVHMQYGIYYDILSDYDSAVYHYHEAAIIGEKGDSLPSLLKDVYYYLSILYEPIGQPDKAMEYGHKSLEIALELGNWSDAAYTAMSIADVHWHKEQYREAIDNYYRALGYARDTTDYYFFFTAFTNMGSIYLDAGQDLDSARYYFDKCYEMQPRLSEEQVALRMHAETNLFKYYFKIGEYNKAKVFLNKAYSFIPSLNNPYTTAYFYKYFSEYYAAIGQMDSAYFYINKHYSLQDSINGFEVKQSLQQIETKYRTAKKEKRIVQLQNQQKIDHARKQILLTIIIFTALLFLLTFIFFLINRQKSIKLAEQNEIIQRSYNEIENLIRESHHRIKNNLQVVSSLLKMQSKNVQSEEARTSLIEAFNRVKTIAVLHQKLQGSQTFTVIRLRDFIDQLTDNIRGSITHAESDISIHTDVEELEVDTDQSISLGLIINELITNSLKYAFEKEEGRIDVSIHREGEFIELKVADNGRGFPEQFNPIKGSSLGYKIVNSLVTKLKGNLSVQSRNGALINISFPHSPITS